VIPVFISEDIRNKLPNLKLSCIECDVKVSETDDELWNSIIQNTNERCRSLSVGDISRIPAIHASREAYKKCGKDPARYRLSAEALLRRAVQGKGLYKINNVVDLLNLVSVTSGFSIGGYDAGKISGDVVFDIGTAQEQYEGIGRGSLNIENLPVFKDVIGAFGSPSSDSLRTAVTMETTRFLMIIIGFGAEELLPDVTDLATGLLMKYAGALNFEYSVI